MSEFEREPTGEGGFDPWKVYETLATILNRREGVMVRLTGLTKDGEPVVKGKDGGEE